MSNNNSQLQTNIADLHAVLQVLQNKAAPGDAIPEISIDSNGLITATAGSKSMTQQLTTQAARTITPSVSEQTAVTSGVYTTGVVTVAAVPTQTKSIAPTTVAQNVTPDSGKFLSEVTVNAMPTATQATPSINVDSSGLITASATQDTGYVTSGTKSATKQLTTQAAQTITPGTSDKTIDSGRYLTGTQTIKGDSNLVAENIKSGVSIFGVSGTNRGIDTFDATAVKEEIFLNKTAYVDGEKITGSFTIDSELSEQEELLTQLEEILNTKAAGAAPVLQRKTVTPSKSSQVVEPDGGYDGLDKVTINAIPSEYIAPSGTLNITTNGTHDVKNYASATVSIEGSGGDGSGSESPKYIKFTANPATSTSFVIENPFGGIANKVCVIGDISNITSTRKINKYIADWDLKLGAVEAVYTDGAVRYVTRGVDTGVNNAQFTIADGTITLYRYNSATAWDTSCEYEVEIYQSDSDFSEVMSVVRDRVEAYDILTGESE